MGKKKSFKELYQEKWWLLYIAIFIAMSALCFYTRFYLSHMHPDLPIYRENPFAELSDGGSHFYLVPFNLIFYYVLMAITIIITIVNIITIKKDRLVSVILGFATCLVLTLFTPVVIQFTAVADMRVNTYSPINLLLDNVSN